MKTKLPLIAFLLALATAHGFAQKSPDTVRLILDVPLLDFPYQQHASNVTGGFLSGFANPSMSQSLAVSNNLYAAAHYGIKRAITIEDRFPRALLVNGAALAFDILSIYIPLGTAWLHEEYYRAVLTRRDINSFNDVNKFPIGRDVVYVSRSRIRDEDLGYRTSTLCTLYGSGLLGSRDNITKFRHCKRTISSTIKVYLMSHSTG